MKTTKRGTVVADQTSMAAFQSALMYICQIEKEKIKRFRQELKKLPKGSLYLNRTNGVVYFERAVDGQRRSISKDIELVYKLARKRYLTLRINEYETMFSKDGKTVRIQNRSVDDRIRKLLKRYGEAGLEVMRITCTEEQYNWAHAPFIQNTLHEEDKKYSTYSGIMVRSKSEQKIGNELELNGIPYRYEQALSVHAIWMEGVLGCMGTGHKSYYPDFTILTATGELIIWEHLGRVDKENYRKHNAEKISAFRQGEQIKEEMLILTFEADLQKANYLQTLIARRVLPYL